MPRIEKSSVEMRHDINNRQVIISRDGYPAFRLEYDDAGQITKVERNGYDGWKEPQQDAQKNIVSFWEAFQCLP